MLIYFRNLTVNAKTAKSVYRRVEACCVKRVRGIVFVINILPLKAMYIKVSKMNFNFGLEVLISKEKQYLKKCGRIQFHPSFMEESFSRIII